MFCGLMHLKLFQTDEGLHVLHTSTDQDKSEIEPFYQ